MNLTVPPLALSETSSKELKEAQEDEDEDEDEDMFSLLSSFLGFIFTVWSEQSKVETKEARWWSAEAERMKLSLALAAASSLRLVSSAQYL